MKIKKLTPSVWVIILYFLVIPFMNFNHHNYDRTEGVIVWDIKSYYAYLPAAIIYKDMELKFASENPKKFNKWIWPVKTPTGKKCILTTMGVSVMYSPFFLIAHNTAKFSDKYEADGYTKPYHVALTFSALVYLILALAFLRVLLLRYYSELATTITLLAIAAGTNLMNYVTYEAPMSHVYSFTLIIILIYYLDNWNRSKSSSWKNCIQIGLLAGLITLIRPTNIIVLVLIPLWGVNSIKSFREKFYQLITNWPKIIVMTVMFLLVWVPQFLYWYKVSGNIFFYSYGEVGGAFFFNNPQIFDALFSYKKGLFVYTPIIFISTISIFFLFKQKSQFSIAILVFFLINLYILTSWWSWWFGGSYSIRAYIDSYGLMAFPLAAIIDEFKHKKYVQYSIVSVLVLLTAHNEFQLQQYRKLSIHYFWMNKEAYWESFLTLRPTCKYWNILNRPNIEKARQGVYELEPYVDDRISREDLFQLCMNNVESDRQFADSLFLAVGKDSIVFQQEKTSFINNYIDRGLATREYKELRIVYLENQMRTCSSWKKDIEKLARRRRLDANEVMRLEAERIFNTYSQKYIK